MCGSEVVFSSDFDEVSLLLPDATFTAENWNFFMEKLFYGMNFLIATSNLRFTTEVAMPMPLILSCILRIYYEKMVECNDIILRENLNFYVILVLKRELKNAKIARKNSNSIFL